MPDVSVVVPVYQSEKTIAELCERIMKTFDDNIHMTVEVILVNDGSTDMSWDIMMHLKQKDPRIKIIRLARNFGQHSAIFCGLKHAEGNYVVTMDDDLQHPPEEIYKLIKQMIEKPDIDVVISRYLYKNHNWLRNLGSKIFNCIMASIFGLDKKSSGGSFRLIKSNIVREIIKTTTYRPRIGVLLVLATNNIDYVEVLHEPRKHGKSGYSILRLVKDFVNNIVNNSVVLLHLTSGLGIFSSLLSFFLFLYYFGKYLIVGVSVSGFTTIVLINLFYFGVMLFSLGVVGEYLIRILFETKGYPQYVIKEKQL